MTGGKPVCADMRVEHGGDNARGIIMRGVSTRRAVRAAGRTLAAIVAIVLGVGMMLIVLSGPLSSPAQAEALQVREARDKALQSFPGRVVGSRRTRHAYEFDIEQDDGTRATIAVEPERGRVSRIRIEQYGERFADPDPRLSHSRAKKKAENYIERTVAGARPSRVRARTARLEYTDARRWAYIVKVRVKNDHTLDYTVMVDAMTGDIMTTYLAN